MTRFPGLPLPAGPGPRPPGATRRFARAEDGSLMIFALFMMAAMILATGLAIDVARSEVTRTKLQNTLDRAVLAAADLEQSLDPKEVVQDYFDRADLGPFLNGSEVTQGINFRTVDADADVDMRTLFLNMVGMPAMNVPSQSQANETVENVEISLVLDISGSMRFDDRITPMRNAAEEFIDTVLAGRRQDGTTVSIVPYAGQVNPGPILFDLVGGVRDHDHSSCVFIEDADFDHSGMIQHSSRQSPHFHRWPIAWSHMDWGWCPSDDAAIQVMSNDPGDLGDFVQDVRLHDGTGTHYGMRWGLALLDPASRSTISSLRSLGGAGPEATGRPLDWDAPNSQKFIVLMTDGNITDQFEPEYTGLRDIDEDDEDNENHDMDNVDGIDHDILNAQEELDDQRDTEGRRGGYRERVTGRSHNVSNFYAACDAAKANGIIVYTIAFEANPTAADEMRNCASTPTNFYEVSQLEIGAAFSSIARQINQLRLTH